MSNAPHVYAECAPLYRERGFWPRPVTQGSKACHVAGWQNPDLEIGEEVVKSWLVKFGDHGIGLLMGSPFPDGTTLGALDVDRDEYTRLGRALLRKPICERFGKKGAVFFVRVHGAPKNNEFKVHGDKENRWGKVAEALFVKKFVVIPPTIHPGTEQPYRWVGTPLHEVNFRDLPIVEMNNVK